MAQELASIVDLLEICNYTLRLEITHLDRLVNVPLSRLDSLPNTPEKVDEELTLYSIVDHYCSVGYVQSNEPSHCQHHQYPAKHQTIGGGVRCVGMGGTHLLPPSGWMRSMVVS